jgi:hypothetical protein
VFLPTAAGAKERRGAQVVVTNLDGTAVSGELLAVKDDTLVILDGSTSGGVTAGLKDVRNVRIVKRSRLLARMGKGFLIGGGVGAGLGALSYDESRSGWFYPDSRGQGALWGGAAGGVCGALLGLVVGAAAGADVIVWVDTGDAAGISRAAFALHRWARVR